MTRIYRTVASPATATVEDRDSTFVGRVRPVESVVDAEAAVEEVRETHPDATHVVPAYRVRPDADEDYLREYANDAGEPGGSAGKPALGVLRGEDLENVVATVVRYYGGTNLGIGGLVRAYAGAVREAVETTGVVEVRPHERLTVTVAYDDSGTVRSIIESEGHAFEAAYDAEVRFAVRVPSERADALRDRIRSATSDRATLE